MILSYNCLFKKQLLFMKIKSNAIKYINEK
jgi:hypothetical protein